jgi:hypothetical protein
MRGASLGAERVAWDPAGDSMVLRATAAGTRRTRDERTTMLASFANATLGELRGTTLRRSRARGGRLLTGACCETAACATALIEEAREVVASVTVSALTEEARCGRTFPITGVVASAASGTDVAGSRERRAAPKNGHSVWDRAGGLDAFTPAKPTGLARREVVASVKASILTEQATCARAFSITGVVQPMVSDKDVAGGEEMWAAAKNGNSVWDKGGDLDAFTPAKPIGLVPREVAVAILFDGADTCSGTKPVKAGPMNALSASEHPCGAQTDLEPEGARSATRWSRIQRASRASASAETQSSTAFCISLFTEAIWFKRAISKPSRHVCEADAKYSKGGWAAFDMSRVPLYRILERLLYQSETL